MEVSLMEHETFLLYLSIFILFFFCCMMGIVAAQLYDYVDRVVKERDELLKLLGRKNPREHAMSDKNTLVVNLLQKRINTLKEASVKINEEVAKRRDLIITARPKQRHRKIFIEKVLDVE